MARKGRKKKLKMPKARNLALLEMILNPRRGGLRRGNAKAGNSKKACRGPAKED